MKSFIRISLTTIAAVMFFSVFIVGETKAQGVLNDILKRMDEHNKALVSLQSDVTMVKFNSQLGEPDTTEGSSIYLPATSKRKMLVRIDWKKPVEESLAVVNNQYVLYRPRLDQAITGKADQSTGNAKAGGALTFMSMSKEQLKTNYSVKYLGQETVKGGTQTWHLELTPKNASTYKTAELWVDSDGMPIQAKVVEKNNDSTTVLLSNIKKNVKIDPSVFSIKLTKKTKIVNG